MREAQQGVAPEDRADWQNRSNAAASLRSWQEEQARTSVVYEVFPASGASGSADPPRPTASVAEPPPAAAKSRYKAPPAEVANLKTASVAVPTPAQVPPLLPKGPPTRPTVPAAAPPPPPPKAPPGSGTADSVERDGRLRAPSCNKMHGRRHRSRTPPTPPAEQDAPEPRPTVSVASKAAGAPPPAAPAASASVAATAAPWAFPPAPPPQRHANPEPPPTIHAAPPPKLPSKAMPRPHSVEAKARPTATVADRSGEAASASTGPAPAPAGGAASAHVATADVAPVGYHTQHHKAWRRVGISPPSQRVVARDLQERGIRNQSYIVLVAYGRQCRADPPDLSHIINVEYNRNADDKRRREHVANWCFRPPTWT